MTEAGWAHILSGHTVDMVGREHLVRAAIEQADFLTDDADHPRRECHYYRPSADVPMLKVVVGYDPVPPPGGWSGTVITAYQVGEVKRKERQRWP